MNEVKVFLIFVYVFCKEWTLLIFSFVLKNDKNEMAYVIEAKKGEEEIKGLPVVIELKNGLKGRLQQAREKDFEQMRALLNETIEEGLTYPQLSTLDPSQFKAYFLSHYAFSVTLINENHKEGEEEEEEVIGCFYIKPNFPGRSSHICNGGFLTKKERRGLGVATEMAKRYLRLAREVGFRASFFNLVYVSNAPSLRIWEKLNFQCVGVVPNAGLLSNGVYTDAKQFYFDLTTLD